MGLGIKGVPAKVKGVVTEVTNKLSSGNVLHDEKLKSSNEGNNLGNSGTRDGGKSTKAVGDISESGSGVVNVSRKADSGLLDEVSDDGKHGDTSVLDLDVTETVELLLVTIGDKAKGIEESERSLGTKLVLEGLEGGGGGGLLGGSESGGGGDEGGKDGELHFDCLVVVFVD